MRIRVFIAVAVLSIVAAVALRLKSDTPAPANIALPSPLHFVQSHINKGCGPLGFLTLNPCYKGDYYTIQQPFREFSPSVVNALRAQGYQVNYNSDPNEPTFAFKDGKRLYIDFDYDTSDLRSGPLENPDSRLFECAESETCSVVLAEL
jgi:hypothetical protein